VHKGDVQPGSYDCDADEVSRQLAPPQPRRRLAQPPGRNRLLVDEPSTTAVMRRLAASRRAGRQSGHRTRRGCMTESPHFGDAWTAAQQTLADAVTSIWVSRRQWQTFQWVDHYMARQGLDAVETLSSFPTVGGSPAM